MPALDELIGNTATHIADQNKHVPIKTLCGQALDKDTTRYFAVPDNFEQATCKVCRGIYFDQDWRGETRENEPSENQKDQELDSNSDSIDTESDQEDNAPSDNNPAEPSTETDAPPTRRLFARLEPPVNKHPKENEDGS